MGHVRLGQLPHTRRWKAVVDLITAGADAAQVAKATIEASQKAMSYVQDDVGVREAIQLLVGIAESGRRKAPADFLRTLGVQLPPQPNTVDLAVGISQALDRRIDGTGKRSDFGEKAKGALIAAVTEHVEGRMGSLFNGVGEDATVALRGLHTEKGFGRLGRAFFGNLMYGSMDYFLSRTLDTHIGSGQTFATMNQKGQFDKALKVHCGESAKIVEDYCGQWICKHRFTEGGTISPDSIDGFGRYGIEKMRGEFAYEDGKNDS